jgi:hypothetical protein
MPNWCDNTLRVTGDAEALNRFATDIKNEDGSIQILKNLIPFPVELEGNDITDKDGNVIAKAFSDAGYSWCLRNWGTKWGDCETELSAYPPGELVYTFQTAWSPALAGIERISRLFPTLTFQTDWVEEGVQSIGAASYQDGRESIYDVPESDFPSWEEDENGEIDWQSLHDAVGELRQQAIERV